MPHHLGSGGFYGKAGVCFYPQGTPRAPLDFRQPFGSGDNEFFANLNGSYEASKFVQVQILQTLLQMYAGTQIFRARAKMDAGSSKPEAELFDRLLKTDTEAWESEIRKSSSEVPLDSLKSEVQRTMESVVLGLENGSMSQQVQAEYLRELVSRIETIQKTMQ